MTKFWPTSVSLISGSQTVFRPYAAYSRRSPRPPEPGRVILFGNGLGGSLDGSFPWRHSYDAEPAGDDPAGHPQIPRLDSRDNRRAPPCCGGRAAAYMASPAASYGPVWMPHVQQLLRSGGALHLRCPPRTRRTRTGMTGLCCAQMRSGKG